MWLEYTEKKYFNFYADAAVPQNWYVSLFNMKVDIAAIISEFIS